MDYDLEEARQIAKRAAERLRPNPEARDRAASQLLDVVKKIGAEAGFDVRLKANAGVVEFFHELVGSSRVVVGHNGANWHCYLVKGNSSSYAEDAPLPLTYNPGTEMFEGLAADEFRVPSPGQPRSQRSAVAVIMEAVERAFESLS
jgi:hypothetical protein